MAQAKKQPKLHWFLLAYSVPQAGHSVVVSQFASAPTKDMNLPQLEAARTSAKLPENSCLTGVSYLGRMTADEFNPPPAVEPKLIAPTEAFMDGYHASVQMRDTGETPVNPFVADAPGAEMSQEGIDWAEGLIAGCKRYGAVGKTSADL